MSLLARIVARPRPLFLALGCVALFALPVAVMLHFRDDPPPDMSLFEPPVLAGDAAVHAAWAADSVRLTPKNSFRGQKMRLVKRLAGGDRTAVDPARAMLAEHAGWLAAWEAYASSSPRVPFYNRRVPESDNVPGFSDAKWLHLLKAILLLSEDDESAAFAELGKVYRFALREGDAGLPSSREMRGWDDRMEGLLLEAARRAKTPELAERLLSMPLPSEAQIYRGCVADEIHDRLVVKLMLEGRLGERPKDFPRGVVPKNGVEWAQFCDALEDRWERANLLPNATLLELLRVQARVRRNCESVALGRPAPFDLSGDFGLMMRRNWAGHVMLWRCGIVEWAAVQRPILDLRVSAIRRACLLYAIRHGGRAPAALSELGLPALTLLDPYSGKPFRYDAKALRLFTDMDASSSDPGLPILLPEPAAVYPETVAAGSVQDASL